MKKDNHKSFIKILLIISIAVTFLSCSPGLKAPSDGSNTSPSTEPGVDRFLNYAWHLKNTGQSVFAHEPGVAGMDLNLELTWLDEIFGQGVHVRVSDDGVADDHPDLRSNFLRGVSLDFTRSSPYTSNHSRPKVSLDVHGTAVAGLISGTYNNSIGAAGVAPRSQFSSANFLSENVQQSEALLLLQADGQFDVLNMSWGTSQNTFFPIEATYENLLKQQVTTGRDGKGRIFVKAAGNDFFVSCNHNAALPCVGNANMDPDASNPYTILVGGLNAKGTAASYSSPGSNLWISAFGGEDGISEPGIFTTDRPNCSTGYAKTSNSTAITFERGRNGNTNCHYTSAFGGTSAAAPQISGVVALLLSANPELTWRDIKYILAKTARKIDPSRDNPITTHPLAEARGFVLPTDYVYELAWTQNAAGFHFHNWYGFGLVDVDAAVALAKNYTANLGPYNEFTVSSNLSEPLAIPDFSSTGVSHTLNITQNFKIESVRVSLSVFHNDISDLAIELTSPSGTKSILMNIQNSLVGMASYTEQNVLLSNAFYQENSAGLWTIRILDGDAGITGRLDKWNLHISGSPN